MSNKPTHTAYVVIDPREGSDKKAQWIEVGAIWPHKNGQGFRPSGPRRDQPLRPHRLPRAQGATGRVGHRAPPDYPAGPFPFSTGDFSHADLIQRISKPHRPSLALQRARQIESDETETLDFQSYDGTKASSGSRSGRAADWRAVAGWESDDLRLRPIVWASSWMPDTTKSPASGLA